MGNAAVRPTVAEGDGAGFVRELREHFPRILSCAESSDPSTVRATAMIFAEESARPEQRESIVELGGVRLLAPFAESSDPYVQLLSAHAMAYLSSEECNQASFHRRAARIAMLSHSLVLAFFSRALFVLNASRRYQ